MIAFFVFDSFYRFCPIQTLHLNRTISFKKKKYRAFAAGVFRVETCELDRNFACVPKFAKPFGCKSLQQILPANERAWGKIKKPRKRNLLESCNRWFLLAPKWYTLRVCIGCNLPKFGGGYSKTLVKANRVILAVSDLSSLVLQYCTHVLWKKVQVVPVYSTRSKQ